MSRDTLDVEFTETEDDEPRFHVITTHRKGMSSLRRHYKKFASYFWTRKHMSDRDRVLLTPWEEWRKYHRFPVELLGHASLLAVVTIQIMLMTYQFTGYNRSNEDTFKRIFHPEQYRDGIYSIQDCLDVIQYTVDLYYKFPYISIDRFEVVRDDKGVPIPPKMTVIQFKSLSREFYNFTKASDPRRIGDFATVEQVYHLTLENSLGPLNSSFSDSQITDLHRRFYMLKQFTISFSFRNLDIGGLAPIPYIWTIVQTYDFSQGGEIKFDISTDIRFMRTKGLSGLDIFTVTALLIVSLSCLMMTISVLSLRRSYEIFSNIKRKYNRYSHAAEPRDYFPSWDSIPWKLKFFFFGGWPIHSIICSFVLILSCFFGFFTQFGASINEWYNILTGIGCLMLCVTIIRYLGYSKTFYSLTLTWASSFFRTLSFLVTVCPIFLGYVLFGMLNFAQFSSRFVDFNTTAITLYSLLLGDDVRSAFVELAENSYPYPIVPKFYLFTFVTFFITSVLNVFIFIIEDSYHTAKGGHLVPVLPGKPPSLQTRIVGGGPANIELSKQMSAPDILLQSYDKQLSVIFDNVEKWERKLAADPRWSYLVEQEHAELARITEDDVEEGDSVRGEGYGDEEGVRRHNLQKSRDYDGAIPLKVLSTTSSNSTITDPTSLKSVLQARIDAAVERNKQLLSKEIEESIQRIQDKFAESLRQELTSIVDELVSTEAERATQV